MNKTIKVLSENCANLLLSQQKTIAMAESCTGGLVTYSLSQNAGISPALLGGFVTYSNEMKHDVLAVPQSTLETHGAVSEETLTAMLDGCMAKSNAQIVIATTGIAGPTGGSEAKPVGTVWLGLKAGDQYIRECHQFDGGRVSVQEQTVERVLELLLTLLRR